LCAVFAVLLSALLPVGTDAPSAAAAAALLVMFAALHGLRARPVIVVVHADGLTYSRHDEPAVVLSGRVTDPVHHPLRPRAPGLA
jgi:hypothetical protein